ncbi:UPF0158 family protein [Actinomycetospora sp. C-140]
MTFEVLRELRGATHRGDGHAVLALLEDGLGENVLQHAGDGLLLALSQGVPGASEQASACARALRGRDWPGDDELAAHLEARGVTAPSSSPLPVDLDAVSDLLEGDPRETGGRIDLLTGEAWPDDVFDPALTGSDEEEDLDDPERWLPIERVGARDGYRDMALFADALAEPVVADRLRRALDGRGAFHRFRAVLDRWPDHIGSWRTYSDERRRGRARAWLADAGYAAVPRAPTDSSPR